MFNVQWWGEFEYHIYEILCYGRGMWNKLSSNKTFIRLWFKGEAWSDSELDMDIGNLQNLPKQNLQSFS